MKLKDLEKVMDLKPYIWLEDKNHNDIANSKHPSEFESCWSNLEDTEIKWMEIGDSFMTITLDIE